MVFMTGDHHIEKSAPKYPDGSDEKLTSPRNKEERAGHFGTTFFRLPANGVREAGIGVSHRAKIP